MQRWPEREGGGGGGGGGGGDWALRSVSAIGKTDALLLTCFSVLLPLLTRAASASAPTGTSSVSWQP